MCERIRVLVCMGGAYQMEVPGYHNVYTLSWRSAVACSL